MVEAKWPTPMAGTPAQNGNSAAGSSDFSRKAEELALAVMWGTPRGSDGEKGGPNQSFGAGGMPLPAQAAQWATPTVIQTREGWTAEQIAARQEEVRSQTKLKGDHHTGNGFGMSLGSQAANWPTPASRDWKGENGADHLTNGTGRLHLDQLPNFVAHCFTPPAQRKWTSGVSPSIWRPISRRLLRSATSQVSPTSLRRWLRQGAWKRRRLNPLFTEWLMAWPPGHALCDCSETGFILWQRQMRGALSRLPTASGPWIWKPPAETQESTQMDLF